MNINLSEEMIEKITFVAFGRIHDLQEKEKAIKDSIAVGKTQIARKQNLLKTLKKAKEDANDVHSLFLELLNQIEEA